MNINRQEISRFAGFIGAAMMIAGYVRHTIQGIWGWFNLSLLIVGAVLFLASIVLNFGSIAAFFRGRSGRLGTNTAVMSIAVIAILGILNFVGFRHHKRFDLTSEKLYTLSDQTRKILTGLQKDVKVIKFDKQNDQRLRDQMSEFRYAGKRISYEFVDYQVNPGLAQQYKIGPREVPVTIVVSGDRVERLQSTDEQSLANAILKVTRDKVKTICFVEGHGEKPITGTEPEGYGAVEKGMKGENYETKSVNLVSSNQVPSECSVLVIAGPTKAFFPQEVAMVGKYLDEGGKAFLMVDPDTDPGLGDIFKAWNIDLGNNTVIDVSGVGRLFGTGPAVPLVATYGSHPITKDLGRTTATFFPLARSVKTGQSARGEISSADILKTSDASWAETELKGNEAKFDEGKDNKGPITLGVAESKKVGDKEARLVVVGDSDFASNNYVGLAGNGNLFLNTINWLAQDEDLISIRPKSATNRSVIMTDGQSKFFFWLTFALMPLAVIGTGIYVWWKRR
jgi:ABC-type uncharacterized transport system involved in gliding motility auxiliary subunit